MKTSIIRSLTAAVLVLASSQIMFSLTNTPSDTMSLRLKGRISKTAVNAESTYTVEIIDNNTVIASQEVKAGKHFTFDIKRNGWYGLLIRNKDCVSKLISVNSHVPYREDENVYMLSFELEEPISLAESKHLDPDALDFPLALIAYEKKTDNFNYSEEYTQNIKSNLMSSLLDDRKVISKYSSTRSNPRTK